jgi:23S rRNA (uracil1939-C5)-methyltransferase
MEELLVESLSPRGYGVSRLGAQRVETAHVIPGDRVKVELRGKLRGGRKGRLLEILESSQNRVQAPCKHAGVCGGCSWQQMSYEAQLREKQRQIQEIFCHEQIEPIMPAPSQFRYRNKMEFTFSENRAGMKYLGLMIAQAEPYVYNTEECHLCSSWVTEVLQSVRTWWEASGLKAYHPPRDEGTLRYITFREAFRTGQKMIVLNISGNPDAAPKRADLDAFVAAIPPHCSIFLRIHQTKKGKPTQFYEMHLSGPDHIVEELHLSGGKLSFKISPISFFQPNTLQAERLYDAALSLIAPLKPERVWDLYCGTGTLGMAASRIAKEVIGIELSPEAVLDAEENMRRNQIANCTFLQGDVGKVLSQLTGQPDVVIIDPPRAGLDPLAIRHLQRIQPKAILYISCNPTTQGKNIQELPGYRLQTIQPVDQFPHTYHIENIALLIRQDEL